MDCLTWISLTIKLGIPEIVEQLLSLLRCGELIAMTKLPLMNSDSMFHRVVNVTLLGVSAFLCFS